MKLNDKKKKAAFIAYPEVRAVAAMTDEELRLALAEYGMKPLTRLPDVLQSLTMDGDRLTARILLRSCCKLLPSLLTQPRLVRELVALTLLLGCFGIMTMQSLQAPTSSIEQVALQLYEIKAADLMTLSACQTGMGNMKSESDGQPPRPPNESQIVADSSGSLSQAKDIKSPRPKLDDYTNCPEKVETTVRNWDSSADQYDPGPATLTAENQNQSSDQDYLAQVDPTDDEQDLIESNIIGRAGFPTFRAHFLHR